MIEFKVLGVVRSRERAGVNVTAYSVADGIGESVYRTRRALTRLVDEGLVEFEENNHRSNSIVRVYALTPLGQSVTKALFGWTY